MEKKLLSDCRSIIDEKEEKTNASLEKSVWASKPVDSDLNSIINGSCAFLLTLHVSDSHF